MVRINSIALLFYLVKSLEMKKILKKKKKLMKSVCSLTWHLAVFRSVPLNNYSQGEELHYCPRTAEGWTEMLVFQNRLPAREAKNSR